MPMNSTKKLAAAVMLTSLSSLSVAEPLAPVLGLLGGGLPGLTLIPVAPLVPIVDGGLPDIGALPVDFLALIPVL